MRWYNYAPMGHVISTRSGIYEMLSPKITRLVKRLHLPFRTKLQMWVNPSNSPRYLTSLRLLRALRPISSLSTFLFNPCSLNFASQTSEKERRASIPISTSQRRVCGENTTGEGKFLMECSLHRFLRWTPFPLML